MLIVITLGDNVMKVVGHHQSGQAGHKKSTAKS
jgi:hypothetical protein